MIVYEKKTESSKRYLTKLKNILIPILLDIVEELFER